MCHIGKIVGFLMQPSALLLVLLLVACALLWSRYWNAGRWLVVACAALLLIGGEAPTASWLIYPLEERFHRPDLANAPVDGIIILGGIVIIRTFLSLSLSVEINGHWPWQTTQLAQEADHTMP